MVGFIVLVAFFASRVRAYTPLSLVAQSAIQSRPRHFRKFVSGSGSGPQRTYTDLVEMGKGKKKKAGGGGKGGKQKKGGGGSFADMVANMEIHPIEDDKTRELAELLVRTYKQNTGKSIFDSGGKDLFAQEGGDISKNLWSHPVAAMVVKPPETTPEGSAETEDNDATPEGSAESDTVSEAVSMCVYANPAACETYGYTTKDGYKSLIDKPCVDLAATVGTGKFEGGYTKKLTIVGGGEDSKVTIKASRWLLQKMAMVDGKLGMETIGVAYAWDSWQLEDGIICKPGGVREDPPPPPPTPPTPEELEAQAKEVEAQITAQGVFIRKLKEEDGFKNADEEVKTAVAELQRLKAVLEDLQS